MQTTTGMFCFVHCFHLLEIADDTQDMFKTNKNHRKGFEREGVGALKFVAAKNIKSISEYGNVAKCF